MKAHSATLIVRVSGSKLPLHVSAFGTLSCMHAFLLALTQHSVLPDNIYAGCRRLFSVLSLPHPPPPIDVNGIVAELLTRMHHTHLIPAACHLISVAPPHSQAALQPTPDRSMVRLEVKCAATLLVLHKLVYGLDDYHEL